MAIFSYFHFKVHCTDHKRIQELKLADQGRSPKARAESRRRRRQGGEIWGGNVPLPTGGRVWGKGSAPPQKFKEKIGVKMAYFRGLLVLNFVFSVTKTV